MKEDTPPFTGWDKTVGLIPFPLLLAAATLEFTQPDRRFGTPVVPVAVLSGLTLAWLTLMPLAHPRWPTRFRIGYLVGLLGLMAALVGYSPWFTFVSWVVTVQAFVLFELRWAFFAAAAASIALTIAAGGKPQSPYMLGASLLAPLLIAGWYLGRETESRRRLIGELTDALAANERMRGQLLTQARAAGVHEERQRMAREIHDTLAQEFSAIASQLEAALHSPRPATTWRMRVSRSLTLARDGLAEARRSVYALAPRPLAEAPLPQALKTLTRRWAADNDVDAGFTLDGDHRALPSATETALFRVAQEALTNVGKHARASRAHITLSYLSDRVLLDVRDDGIGFTTGEPGDGFGLSGMRQRVTEVSGSLTVDSEPGEGTTISAAIDASEAI